MMGLENRTFLLKMVPFQGRALKLWGVDVPEFSDTQISVVLRRMDALNPSLSHSQLVDLIQAKASINKSLSCMSQRSLGMSEWHDAVVLCSRYVIVEIILAWT